MKTITNIKSLRKEIDTLDEKILNLISKRALVAHKIGKIKKGRGMELIDNKRKNEVLEKWIKSLKKSGISEKETEKLYHQIHELSVAIERESA